MCEPKLAGRNRDVFTGNKFKANLSDNSKTRLKLIETLKKQHKMLAEQAHACMGFGVKVPVD